MQWQALAKRHADDRLLSVRLQALEPGLAVADGPPADELEQKLREWFVLRPAERAVRRQRWLRTEAGRTRQWQASARELRWRRRDLVALDKELIDRLGYQTER